MLDAGDDAASLIVHRGERAFLVLNKYPYNSGHIMAVPYRHVETLEALDADEMAGLMAMVTLGMRSLREAMRPDGFNVGANIGAAAGAGVKDHVHLHIVPRWSGDNNFMAVLGDVKLIPQLLAETREQLAVRIAGLV
jgi:ATP adenylyltransferase